MATYNKFQDYAEQLNKGVHNWSTHTFKAALSNTAPVATAPVNNKRLFMVHSLNVGHGVRPPAVCAHTIDTTGPPPTP